MIRYVGLLQLDVWCGEVNVVVFFELKYYFLEVGEFQKIEDNQKVIRFIR